jgi:hypothetical protein
MRYLLLGWLLEIRDAARLEELFARYEDDGTAEWLYAQALHAFRVEGDTPHARAMRGEALQQNPYVPDYLVGRKRLPRRLPEYIGFGDEREAIACAANQIEAWRQTAGALAWLAGSR